MYSRSMDMFNEKPSFLDEPHIPANYRVETLQKALSPFVLRSPIDIPSTTKVSMT